MWVGVGWCGLIVRVRLRVRVRVRVKNISLRGVRVERWKKHFVRRARKKKRVSVGVRVSVRGG